MFLTDYHTHSLCSPDGCVPLADMARAAVEAGMSELCLTDHCDLLDLQGRLDLSFRWEPVEEQLSLARPRFDLPIRMGLELGEPWEDPAFSARITSHPQLDFVLGSVHNLDSAHGGGDIYFVNYRSEQDCYAMLDPYFDCVETLAGMDCYDVLAHILYPLRYMNDRDGQNARLDRYEPQLRRIFHRVIDQGKGIEVNTCRGKTVEDWRWLLELYRDCGGTLLTLGSDAHEPKDVGKGISQAALLLQSVGYTHIARYVRHVPTLVPLD